MQYGLVKMKEQKPTEEEYHWPLLPIERKLRLCEPKFILYSFDFYPFFIS